MQTIRTPEKREQFLTALDEFNGNVSKALESAKLSRSAAYDWKNEDEDFSSAWEDIVEATTERLESEAWRRAHNGVERGVYYQGERVATEREYSDSLLMFTLKARKPEKYRDNVKHELGGPNGGPVVLRVVYDSKP